MSDTLIIFNLICHFQDHFKHLYNTSHKLYFGLTTLTIFYLVLLLFIPSPASYYSDSFLSWAGPGHRNVEPNSQI